MRLTHRHIEIFRAVMQSGNLTRAAEVLHTSQPTVSRELARLEQVLGMPLFDRLRGRLQPTARALQLFDEIERSYIGLERIASAAEALRHFASGRLAIACLPALAHSLLPAACHRFVVSHPQASLAITPQESPLLEEWLTEQRFDLGLTEHEDALPATTLRPLFAADEVVVLPDGHPLLSREVLSLADFDGQAFVSLAPQDSYRQQIDALFREHGVKRALVVETTSAVSVAALVRQGLGISVINPLTAIELEGHGLHWRRFAVSIPFKVSLVRPQWRASNPLADSFCVELEAAAHVFQQRLAQGLQAEGRA